MPPCAFTRVHWAPAITWALSFWAIDRPSEPQLSSWSCELDGHKLHSSIPGGCFERSRRFLRSHVLDFAPDTGYFCRSPLDRGIQGSGRWWGSAFYDEEFARSTFSGHRRALNYSDLQAAYRVAAVRLLLLPFASLACLCCPYGVRPRGLCTCSARSPGIPVRYGH